MKRGLAVLSLCFLFMSGARPQYSLGSRSFSGGWSAPLPTFTALGCWYTGSPADSHYYTTPAVDTTGAVAVVVAVAPHGTGPYVFSDSKGNGNATALTYYTSTSGTRHGAQIFYWRHPAVGTAHTFTVYSSVAFGHATMDICVSSIQNITGGFDAGSDVGNASGGATCQATGAVSVGGGSHLIVSAVGGPASAGSTASIDSGFTRGQFFPYTGGSMLAGVGYQVHSGAGTARPTWTTNGSAMSCAMASFN